MVHVCSLDTHQGLLNKMATAATTIPRFLLPQLTWKTGISKSFVPLLYSSQSAPGQRRSDAQHRAISSQATIWRPKNVTNPSKTIENLNQTSRSPRYGPLQTSIIPPQRSFHTTPPLFRDHHFDTLKFVQRLKEEGFSEDQASAMMRVLSDVIEESIQNLTRTMVLREGKSSPRRPLPSKPPITQPL